MSTKKFCRSTSVGVTIAASFILFFGATCGWAQSARDDPATIKKLALVIAVAEYESEDALSNPVNDATDLAAALRVIGFEVEGPLLDPTQRDLRRALRLFSTKAARSEIAVIYFAGHGIEINGENFILPSDVSLRQEDDVDDEAVALSRVLHAVRGARKLRLVIVDACRNNPFSRRVWQRRRSTGFAQGLAPVQPVDEGADVLVSYSAMHGTEAEDGEGRNSPYAVALLKHLGTPGLDVTKMLGRVRDTVMNATQGRQRPFTYGSVGKFDIPLAEWQAEKVTRKRPIFPFSSQRSLTEDDARGLTCSELFIARNEIFHRNGYCFSTPRALANFETAGCKTTNQDPASVPSFPRHLRNSLT